jgi:hypothetical protein
MRLSHVQLAAARSSIALIALGGCRTKAIRTIAIPKHRWTLHSQGKSPLYEVGIAAWSRDQRSEGKTALPLSKPAASLVKRSSQKKRTCVPALTSAMSAKKILQVLRRFHESAVA